MCKNFLLMHGGIMIEIFNVRPINKGNIGASCSIYVKPWDLEINDLTVFQQGVNKWVSFPRKKYETNTGETKYSDYLAFRDPQKMTRLRKLVLDAVDDYILKNGDLVPESPIKEGPNPFDMDIL